MTTAPQEPVLMALAIGIVTHHLSPVIGPKGGRPIWIRSRSSKGYVDATGKQEAVGSITAGNS